jgi:3-deoxy-manno-octulosonate cytidylyltransferase (CMP-KDO synthetase)
MRCAVIIPARYASSRLPGKPLLKSTGKYLIQHVYEQALRARRPDEVIVATDDPRIVAAVEGFGGKVVMTSRRHPSGTDRVAEVARDLDAEIIINLQGDEPLIDPQALDTLAGLLEADFQAQVATLAVPLTSRVAYLSPNVVKVVRDRQGRALYFSRSPIPMVRDGEPDFTKNTQLFLQHLGIYAYRRQALLKLAALPPDALEQTEKLEQLRVLAMGWPIQVGVIAHAGRGVDTFDDYKEFVSSYRTERLALAA